MPLRATVLDMWKAYFMPRGVLMFPVSTTEERRLGAPYPHDRIARAALAETNVGALNTKHTAAPSLGYTDYGYTALTQTMLSLSSSLPNPSNYFAIIIFTNSS